MTDSESWRNIFRNGEWDERLVLPLATTFPFTNSLYRCFFLLFSETIRRAGWGIVALERGFNANDSYEEGKTMKHFIRVRLGRGHESSSSPVLRLLMFSLARIFLFLLGETQAYCS